MGQHGEPEELRSHPVGLRDEALLVIRHNAGAHVLEDLGVVAFFVDGLLTGAAEHVADAIQRCSQHTVAAPGVALGEGEAEVAARHRLRQELDAVVDPPVPPDEEPHSDCPGDHYSYYDYRRHIIILYRIIVSSFSSVSLPSSCPSGAAQGRSFIYWSIFDTTTANC